MTERKLRVTLELTVRDMTPDEWADATEGAILDDMGGPEGWVDGLDGSELVVCFEGALNSDGNPELFAGSDLFMVTENSFVSSIEWLPKAEAS